jgi:riboflavin synthase
MFTGIVEATGRIEKVEGVEKTRRLRSKRGGTKHIVISAGGRLPVGRLPVGASIAVSGVCLTVTARRGSRFEADLGPETLAKTTLGQLGPGDRVHLERPLRLGDPLGGHLVSGHVDGVGRVKSVKRHGSALELRISAPSKVAPLLAPKGSVAVDGVSLTLNDVTGGVFSVVLIPHTLAITTLGERRAGDRVNIEADLISKHIAQLVKSRVHP